MIDCESKEIYVISGATDMRKGIDGLAVIASLHLAGSFFESAMFIFCNKSRNRVKIIEWDGDGFWLYQKRLERGTFPWPADGTKVKHITITKAEFSCLLSGTKLKRKLCMDEVFPTAVA